MYTTCLFCSAALGANAVIEHFPVGRRLAFDADTGRLWVICRSCDRWNLTPIEERWEAIEEAERLFRATRLRVSTDHVGLAKLGEGLELVRIGKPQRPEIAAWRYGDKFGRRRQRRMLQVGAVAVAGGLVIAGGLAAGLGVITAWQVGKVGWKFISRGNPLGTVARVRDTSGTLRDIKRRDLLRTKLAMGADGGLALHMMLHDGNLGFDYSDVRQKRTIHLEGADARRAASVLFPAVNRLGGTPDEVQQAVGRLERAGSAEQFLADQARRGSKLTRFVPIEESSRYASPDDVAWQSGLLALSTPLSLAIEMALHEEQERRALDGELAELESAWREAEEIGAIADSLLLPPSIEAAIARMRGR
ncbi:MAG: hypothetical protein M3Z05_21235 [Gemmatimonadota bacterium]|nr:hypothetical protein [Gemmatimonadota bacterium]